MKAKLPKTFWDIFEDFYKQCRDLTLMLLMLLTKALGIKDTDFLQNAHQLLGKVGNGTQLRSLYYPAVDSSEVLPEQNRCGEHTDYGTLTLLFPKAEGLEVNMLSCLLNQ